MTGNNSVNCKAKSLEKKKYNLIQYTAESKLQEPMYQVH